MRQPGITGRPKRRRRDYGAGGLLQDTKLPSPRLSPAWQDNATWEGSPLDGTYCPACWEAVVQSMQEDIKSLRAEACLYWQVSTLTREAWHALRATVPQQD